MGYRIDLRLLTILFVMRLVGIASVPASAGGGPENVFLLVNSASVRSKTVANHFVDLRQIPANNVLYVEWNGSIERIGINEFRQHILKPALEAMEQRGLADQIDYLIYSSDFPWSIDLSDDYGEKRPSRYLRTTGSLTGTTYLWRFVEQKSSKTADLSNNWYAEPTGQSPGETTSVGFRSWYGWGRGGKLLEAGGQSYLLSTILAVTNGRGNTVDEVIRYLQSSASADGTRPNGTIYFVENSTPRSTTRHDLFPSAVASLQSLGVRAEILKGKIPREKPDVQGAMIGTARFNWKASGSQILPGAICEHLTSYGGDLTSIGWQTPLSVWLRYGAAGASGTVVEPYSLPEKFPSPAIHVHYARGCTLAEAFYRSVEGPYQLLIVGDPLCRPWAELPTVTVRGIEAEQTIKGTRSMKPDGKMADGRAVERFELFVDGRRIDRCRAGRHLRVNTRELEDGYHELRIVGFEPSPIESQGRIIVPVIVDNRGQSVELEITAGPSISSDQTFAITVSAKDATDIVIYQNRRELAKISGDHGTIHVDPDSLGAGPVRLQAVSLGPDQAWSRPIRLINE